MAAPGYKTISLGDKTYLALRALREELTQRVERVVSMDQVVGALLRECADGRARRRLVELAMKQLEAGRQGEV